MASGQVPVVFECHRCWAILPYLDCPHNCPGADTDDQDEAFEEDLQSFKEEIKESGYLLNQAPTTPNRGTRSRPSSRRTNSVLPYKTARGGGAGRSNIDPGLRGGAGPIPSRGRGDG